MNDKQAEDFVNRFALYLLPDDIRINITKPVKWNETRKRWEHMNIEGADGQSWSLLKGNGNIETKQVNYFLTRGNDHNEPTGTIYFELFQNEDKTKRNEWYAGWLPAICNALDYHFYRKEIRERQQAQGKRVAEVTARTPGALVFALTDDRKPGQPLFACVAFEDIPKLVTRLIEICPDPEGFGIAAPKEYKQLVPELQRPATEYREYWKRFETWNDQYGMVYKNMWYVPFRQIIDLSTVTIIGNNEPDIKTFENRYTQTITAELQQRRLDTLKDRAKERGKMGTLIPEEALAQEQELKKKWYEESGIPADKITPVSIEEIEKRFYDAEALERVKADWEQTRRFVKDATGQDMLTWEENNARMMQKLQRIKDQARTEQ